MRTRLDQDDKLIPPDSVSHARARLQVLDVEIDSIRRQLAGTRNPTFTGAYLEWRESAMTKLEHFKSEREQTVAWIVEQDRQLFHDTVKLLRNLHDGDVGFSDEEVSLLLRAEEAIKVMGGGSGGRGNTGTG